MIQKLLDRPVLATVISILIVILGIIGISVLPITQYPDIAPATVRISANYTGASAETVMKSVVVPIEEAVNGVEGMDYITSTAGNDGSATIQVIFKQGVNPDIAAVNVQNRVSRAEPLLPAEVTRSGVTTLKASPSALMFLSFYSSNKDYDATFLHNFLNINVIPGIKRINGVGDANVFGNRDYSMRIWLHPEKLAGYHLMPADVIAAINEQSREAAAGSIGANSGNTFEFIVKYKGKYSEEKDYENIVIKANGTQLLRLKDVATVEINSVLNSNIAESGGMPAVSMAVYQTPGSNAQVIIEDIKKYLESAKPSFPKGIQYRFNFDSSEFLDASIEKVLSTLLEAFVLVFLVVYLFLQDFRSTLIPAISVPVAIVGTFFFLNLFGFSINLLTLFALVLAIGIVVDDAIVVVEAVHGKMEHGIKTARKATITAMDEITGAIISITLVMACVFIPVTFISGPVGVFYKQFGITLIVAILLSAINALTLSPVLCALLLKPSHNDESYKNKNRLEQFFYKFNIGFKAVTNKYTLAIHAILNRKWILGVLFLGMAIALFFSNKYMPSGFVPNEDRGFLLGNIELPAGASLERTYNVLKELRAKAIHIEGIENITFVGGRNMLSGAGSNYGLNLIKLKDFKERASVKGQGSDDITKKLFGVAATIPEAKIVFFAPSSVPGYGISSGFEIVLLDKTGGNIESLNQVTKNFIQALTERKEIQYAQTSFNTGFPQYTLNVNVERAEMNGVSVSNILSVMQGYVGGVYAADFTKFGKQFRVMVQALPEDRANTADLNKLFVKTASGGMAPISQFASLEKTYGPPSLARFNLFTAVNVNGSNAPGYSTGDAIKAVQEVAAQSLGNNYSIDYRGLTREEVNSGSTTALVFFLSFVFVYFILAAQYESYIIPFAVLLSLPFGIMGAYVGQWLFGLENNVYFQIALIMLIGLLAKNAILIIEFALQRYKQGLTITQAAIEGAKARLRPILMTSLAFICGLIPLVFASGIGSIGNRSIATGAAIGLLIGTILGLLVVPVLYVGFQWLHNKIFERKKYVEVEEE